MKKINKTFIAGMLAMALVFGMIGCDTGTNTVTKEVPIAGPPGSTTTKEVPIPVPVDSELALAGYLDPGNKSTAPVYVVSGLTVSGNLTVPKGKSIVITNDPTKKPAAPVGNAGVLFARSGGVNSTAKLTVNGTLTVEGGGAVILGSETPSTNSGILEITGGGRVQVKAGAVLAVNTSSVVKLTDTTSALTLADDSRFAIVGTLGGSNNADTLVGATENALIAAVKSGKAKVAVGKVRLYNNVADAVKGTDNIITVSETEIGTIITNAATTSDPDGVEWEDGVAEVTYSGTESLPSGTSVPSNGTLIVTGALKQTGTLTVANGGTLEVAGSLTTSGDLEVSGTLEVTGSLTTSKELKVEEDGTLEVAPGAVVTVSGDGGKLTADATAAVAIPEGATLALEDGATLKVASGATFTNEGTIIFDADSTIDGDGTIDNKGTIKTATEDGATLGAILGAAAGKIEATGEVVIAEGNVAVKENTDLTLKKVTIEGGTLDLSALFSEINMDDPASPTGGTPQGSATLEGTIEIGDNGTLNVGVSPEVLGNTSSVPPGLNFGDDAGVKVSKGGEITVQVGSASIEYIGSTSAAYYQWNGDANDDYINITPDELTLSGKIIANHTPGTDKNHTTIIAEDSDITLKFRWTILGKLIVEKDATLTIDPLATLQLPVPQASAQLWIMGTGKVQVSGTIKVAAKNAQDYVGWIALQGAGSNLTLLPGGKLDISADSAIYTYDEGDEGPEGEAPTPRVSVYEVDGGVVDETTATKAKVEKTGSDPVTWTLTTDSNGEDAYGNLPIILGKLSITFTETNAVDNAPGSTASTAAAGTLTAGEDTAIVFLGAEE
jgi:hypothetical protein